MEKISKVSLVSLFIFILFILPTIYSQIISIDEPIFWGILFIIWLIGLILSGYLCVKDIDRWFNQIFFIVYNLAMFSLIVAILYRWLINPIP